MSQINLDFRIVKELLTKLLFGLLTIFHLIVYSVIEGYRVIHTFINISAAQKELVVFLNLKHETNMRHLNKHSNNILWFFLELKV